MELVKANLKSIIVIAILAIGLVAGIYLIKHQQIFKSRANQDLQNHFEIVQKMPDGQSKSAQCVGDTCTVESLDLYLKIKDF